MICFFHTNIQFYALFVEKVFYQFMMALTYCCHSIEFIICFNSRPFYLPLIYTSIILCYWFLQLTVNPEIQLWKFSILKGNLTTLSHSHLQINFRVSLSISILKTAITFYVNGFKSGASLVAQMVKNLPAMQETWVQSLGQEDPLEKGKAIHSSILAWRIPWTEALGRLEFIGSNL